jgi:Pvc16 N-terminal domain
MIDDLDRSIDALLRAGLPPKLVEQISISFATPDDQFPPASVALPAIDLFLYDIRENQELRNNDWKLQCQDNKFTREPPSVRVECSYLVTAWASESSPTRAQDEHRLLGEAMMVLLSHPKLPGEVLQGRLHNQAPPLPAATLQPGRLQSMGEFWQALGGKPKAAFGYAVTIGLQPFEAIEAGGVVEEMTLEMYKKKREEDRRMEDYAVRFKAKPK